MPESDNSFWRFSLAVYAAPGVANECLALQSALDVNVNALLFCAWLGAEKALALDARNIAEIEARTNAWHESVVRSLRKARQSIKTMPEFAHPPVQALRKQIAELELRAEQIEQALLHDDWPALSAGARPAPAEEAVCANIAALLQRSISRPGTPDLHVFPAALISAALTRSCA